VKVVIKTAIRFLALVVVYLVCFVVVSGALLSTTTDQPSPDEAGATLLALLVVSLINAAVWTLVIQRSHWSGWRLILAVFFVLYGVSTLMPQIETAYFVRLPPGMLPRLFLAGLIIAAVFSPLAVLIFGKIPSHHDETTDPRLLRMSVSEWVVKLAVIVVAYVVIYFTFGYFIAWKNPAVVAYYGGNDPGSFITHITNVLRTEPLLFLLQVARGLLWAAIALPVIKMMKGNRWEVGLAVALLFAMTSAQLLIPNPLMPAAVRMAHLVETVTSNFLFGWLVVLVLVQVHHPLRRVRVAPEAHI
jgi:hypothetical protein